MQPISVRGTLWIATLGVACLGLAVGSRRSLRVAAVAGLAWLATAAVTIAWPDEQRFLRAIVLPSGDDAGRAGRLFAERDVSLVGVRAMHAIGGVSDREIEGFAGPLDGVYDAMEALDGAVVVAPFVSTAFGSQSADRFDAFVPSSSRSTAITSRSSSSAPSSRSRSARSSPGSGTVPINRPLDCDRGGALERARAPAQR